MTTYQSIGIMSRMNEKRISTRERILQVSAKMFAEKGYNQTSTRDIAKKLSIASPSLYHHFPSKAAILLALLKDPIEHVQKSLEISKKLTGSERTRSILESFIGAIQFHYGIIVMATDFLDELPEELINKFAGHEFDPGILLSSEINTEQNELLIPMAIGAVRGAIEYLIEKSSTPDDFIESIQFSENLLVDLVMKLLSQ